MANIWGNAMQSLAKATGTHVGNWGTPEWGWTEKAQNVVAPNKGYSTQGGSTLSWPKVVSPIPDSGTTVSTSANGSGGGGGDDKITQLKKAAASGGLNPSQKAELDALMAPTTPGYSGPSDEEINSMYAPVIEAYNQQYNTIAGQEPEYLANIKTTGEEQKKPFDTRLTEGTQELNSQEKATRDAEQSAISQARKLFNELQQYNLARFGSGSSTGQAAMELLGRSTSQNIGQATDTAQKNVATIKDNLVKLGNFVTEQKGKIDSEIGTKTLEAKKWFQDRLSEINNNRAMAESDKASKRYQALSERTAYLNNLNTAKYNYENELYNWRIQRQDELANELRSSSAANPTKVSADDLNAQANTMSGMYPYRINADGGVSAGNEYTGTYTQPSMIIKKRTKPDGTIEYYNSVNGSIVPASSLVG